MSLIGNERTKLSATFLNGISIAMVAAGAIAPLAAATYGLSGAAHMPALGLVSLGWLTGGIVLHQAARWLLRSLRP